MLNTFSNKTKEQEILLIDDDSDFTDSLSEVLQDKGFTVEIVNNREDAKAAVSSSNPGLALIDIRLGSTNGINLIEDLHQIKQDLLCVIMTAHTSEEMAISALRNGAYDYLRKPFDINYFLVVVNRCFDRIFIEQQKQRVETELKISETRYQQLYHETPAMFFTVSKSGAILSANKYGAECLGFSVDQMQQQFFANLYREEDIKEIQNHLKQLFSEQQTHLTWELKKKCQDEKIIWVRETARLVHDCNHETVALIVSEDITESKNLEQQLSYQASHDPLTSLVNRSCFEQLVSRAIDGAIQENHSAVLLFMDLDQFKVVNDTCGHHAGDELLKQISVLIESVIRESDHLGRIGGDEFAVLLEGCDIKRAQQIAELIIETVSSYPFSWENKTYVVGISIGMVPVLGKEINFSELMIAADAACYLAKDKGRNRAYLYEHDNLEQNQHIGQMRWVTRIQAAIDENRMIAYAQPAVDIHRQNKICSYELLVRMIDTDGSIILPGAFLPAAEQYNLISKIDRIMICHAINIQNKMRTRQQALPTLAVNLAGQSLCDNSLLGFIIESIASGELDAKHIIFEITETQAIQNLKLASAFIQQLNKQGCRFYLDDFGTGLSSFAYLNTLAVNSVKIDGVFVKDISTNKIHRAMVKSINEIAHIMNKETIAEFVTNQETVEFLKEIGVDYAQGYLFGEPQPIDELF